MDLKCGYLDFRNPAKESWYTVRLWTRKWVEVRVNTASEGRSVLLEAYEDQNEFDKTVICVLLENVTTVRRAPIKNRYALEIYSGDRPMVYLAADSETVCHEWVSVLKRALLPSMPAIRKLPDVGSVFHHVWALPMGSADKLRLKGEFLLAITGDSFVLYNETGTLCLQWKLIHIKRFAVCNDKDISPADYGKILYVNTGSECQDGEGEFFFYSIQAKDILQQMLDKISEAMERIKLSQQREGREQKEAGQQTDDLEDKTFANDKSGTEDDEVDGDSQKDEAADNVSVNTSISWTSDSSEGSKVEKTCLGTDSATTVNNNAKEKPSKDPEMEALAGSVNSAGNSNSAPENVRTPPDGYDQPKWITQVTSPQSVQALASEDQRKDLEPMATSPSSLSGTLLFRSPAVRVRGNSTSSSGYGSDPLETNGLSEYYKSDRGQSEDSNSITSSLSSNVSFVDRLPKIDSFQSDTCTFSLSSGLQRLTKTRRNTFSGSNNKNDDDRDREQITECDYSRRKRMILRRSTLSSINELYRLRADDFFNQGQRSFLKDASGIVPRKNSVDSLGNSSLDEFETNDLISDTSVDDNADIPAPFDLLDVYSLSARAKLMKDSETAGDRSGGHMTPRDAPPTLPARKSSLQVRDPTWNETKTKKTKEKKPRRRKSSILTSIAERLLQSSGSTLKKKGKEGKMSGQSLSKSCPSTPASSPPSRRKSNKENNKSSKYKINLRWSKNKNQYKSCQSLDQCDCTISNSQSLVRPNSFHGTRSTSILRQLSKQENEILMKYCPDPNNGPENFKDGQLHPTPTNHPIRNTSGQSETRTHSLRKQRIQSLGDMIDDGEEPPTSTWKSLEMLAGPSLPPKTKALPLPDLNSIRATERTRETNSVDTHSVQIDQHTSRENLTRGQNATLMQHGNLYSTEKISTNKQSFKSKLDDDDVCDGYIKMNNYAIETYSDEEIDDYYTHMN